MADGSGVTGLIGDFVAEAKQQLTGASSTPQPKPSESVKEQVTAIPGEAFAMVTGKSTILEQKIAENAMRDQLGIAKSRQIIGKAIEQERVKRANLEQDYAEQTVPKPAANQIPQLGELTSLITGSSFKMPSGVKTALSGKRPETKGNKSIE